MKNLFLPFLGLFSLLMVGCHDEILLNEYQKNESEQVHTVSLERALKQVTPFYKGASGSTRTSEEIPEVESLSIHLIGGKSTRAQENGIPFYIVNFKDHGGFAILSGDDRLTPVYAFSNEGAINLNDTISNYGLNFYINKVMPEIVADELITKTGTKSTGDNYDPILEPKVVFDVPPMLDVEQRNWNQSYPYNRYCITSTGERAKVGCGAVATSLIMSYYRWPVELEGYKFEWEKLLPLKNSVDRNQFARFMEILGRPQYLNMKYGVEGSGCSIDSVERTFSKLGYKFDKFDYLDVDHARQSLRNGSPLVIFGTHLAYSSMSHVFVIDGFCTEYMKSEPSYFHCVWGWGSYYEENAGLGNGYYLIKWTTHRIDPKPTLFDENDNGTKPDGLWLMYFNTSMLYNFSLNP